MASHLTAPSVRLDSIPALLRQTPHWVHWRYVQNPTVAGQAEGTPTPVSVATGRLVSVNVPTAWTDFTRATDALPNSRSAGLGFVLHRPRQTPPDQPGLVALLLGQCRDPRSGRLDDWARDVVQAVGSYTELSPDGRGLCILLLGVLPARGRQKGNFANYQTDHFLAITGRHFFGTPVVIERRQEALTRVHGWFFAGNEKKQQAPAIGRRKTHACAAAQENGLGTDSPPEPDEEATPDDGPWSNLCEVALPLSLIDARLQRRVGRWPRRIGARLFVPGADGRPLWLDSSQVLFAWIEQRLGELGLPAPQWQTTAGACSPEAYYRHLQQFAVPCGPTGAALR